MGRLSSDHARRSPPYRQSLAASSLVWLHLFYILAPDPFARFLAEAARQPPIGGSAPFQFLLSPSECTSTRGQSECECPISSLLPSQL